MGSEFGIGGRRRFLLGKHGGVRCARASCGWKWKGVVRCEGMVCKDGERGLVLDLLNN